MMLITASCKKEDNKPEPAKKKYAWVVGDKDSTEYGMILFTPDGGDTWLRQGQGAAALYGVSLANVWAVDTNIVWAVGLNNVILRTSDGGSNWSRITPPVNRPDIDLLSISLLGSNDVWISGSKGIVYHSANGGSTWSTFDSTFFRKGLLQGIHAVNQQTVYVVGQADQWSIIARTINGGQTWDTIAPENNYNIHLWIGAKSIGTEHIVIYGGRAHYIYSHDAGVTWKNDSVPNTGGIEGADINCLTMLDANTWWGAFDYECIYITTNAGTSWVKQTSSLPGGMFLVGIDYYDRNLALIAAQSSVSRTGKIMKTSDGGNLWELKLHTRSWINKVSFIKN